jgi:hypothetical protein
MNTGKTEIASCFPGAISWLAKVWANGTLYLVVTCEQVLYQCQHAQRTHMDLLYSELVGTQQKTSPAQISRSGNIFQMPISIL